MALSPAAAWTNSHKSGSPDSGRASQRLLACKVSAGREHKIERINLIHAEQLSIKGSISSQLQLEGISSETGSGLTLAGEIRVKSELALTAKTSELNTSDAGKGVGSVQLNVGIIVKYTRRVFAYNVPLKCAFACV